MIIDLFHQKTLKPAWNKIGSRAKTDEQESVALLRPQLFLWLGMIGNDPDILNMALDYVLTDPLRPNELGAIPRYIRSGDQQDQKRVWNWFKSNYLVITEKTSSTYGSYLPNYASICSGEILAEAEEFFSDPDKQTLEIKRSMRQVRETVNSCLELRERVVSVVSTYLHNFRNNRKI
jgi:hypothetical protein